MMRTTRTLTYRSNARGLSNLPLRVRSTGRYRVGPDWKEQRLQKWFFQLFWTVSGRGSFGLEDQRVEIGTGEIFIYRPGDFHEVRAVSDFWDYCWLTLDHASAGLWLDGFGLEKRSYAPGECPASLFSQITAALKECTSLGERRAAHLAHAVLLGASSVITEPVADSLSVRARDLLDKNFEKPAWGVSDIVNALSIHRTTLLRSFNKHYGLTPSRYLQNRRLQKALSLLRKSDLQIQEVAWRAGFSDANYLARAVHQATGMSPREFRKQ